MPATLLPPNASPLEGCLEQAMARYDDGRDVPIDALWDPHRCPAPLLPWLAWALGVRRWDAQWSGEVKRRVIAGAVPLRRIEGTVGAIRAHLDALGAEYDVVERPGGAPFTAAITLHNSAEVGAAATARLRDQIDDVTRLSVGYTLTLAAGATLAVPVALGAGAATVADFRVPVDGPLFPAGSDARVLAAKATLRRFTLPAARGGVAPLRYALSPALPGGLVRDGRILSGTPIEAAAVTPYTWTATDARGVVATVAVPLGVAFESWRNPGQFSAAPAALRLTWGAPPPVSPWMPPPWWIDGARATWLNFIEVTSAGQVTLSLGPHPAANPLRAAVLPRLRASLTQVSSADGSRVAHAEFGGPADPTAQARDTTEPYVWTPAAAEVAALQAFVRAAAAANQMYVQIWEVAG